MNTKENSTPHISVVIPTCNRAELLRLALEGLCQQTLKRNRFEVVVVDDGSTDNTERVVTSFSHSLFLRYARQSNAGISAAKNHGLSLSRAPIVVFLDDDDVMESDCLEQHLHTHEMYPDPNIAVLGYTDLGDEIAGSPLMNFVTGTGSYLFSYNDLRDGETLDFTYFWGGRSSCKRMFLLRNGVFNPRFRFGAEDIELGYRLSQTKANGLRVVFNRNAISHMMRKISIEDFLRRCYRQGQSNWLFRELHPVAEVREWTETNGLEAEWRIIRTRYADVHKMVCDLDHLASHRVRRGIPTDSVMLHLLYRAYHAAFRAVRIKGSIDRKHGITDEPTFSC